MEINEVLYQIKNKMQNSQDIMSKELSSIRTEFSNPNILDKINIIYYDVKTPLKQLCSINVVKGNQLNIKPYENTLIPQIKKAILASDLGINPSVDSTIIKLVFPPLTEEIRKQLIKKVDKIAENTKIIIRNIRRDGNNQIKKMQLTKDLEIVFLKKMQDLTDEYIKSIEFIVNNKNKELVKI